MLILHFAEFEEDYIDWGSTIGMTLVYDCTYGVTYHQICTFTSTSQKYHTYVGCHKPGEAFEKTCTHIFMITCCVWSQQKVDHQCMGRVSKAVVVELKKKLSMCHFVKALAIYRRIISSCFMLPVPLARSWTARVSCYIDTRSLFTETISSFTSYSVSCSLNQSYNRLLTVAYPSMWPLLSFHL